MRDNKAILLPFLCGFFLATSSLAQTPIQTSTLQAFDVQVLTPELAPVRTVSASVIGTHGAGRYYYWIVARYAQGNASPSSPVQVNTAPNVLSASNKIRITWSAMPDATGYDVLRTIMPKLPNDVANVAVAVNVPGTLQDDAAPGLLAYTITTLAPRQISLRMQAPFLNLLGSPPPALSLAGQGRIYFDSVSNQFMASVNGGPYGPFGGGLGAGITSLNGLLPQIQTFATGTAGVDFNIASAGFTHTFNLPSASHTARGALLSADWDSFSAKAQTGSCGAGQFVNVLNSGAGPGCAAPASGVTNVTATAPIVSSGGATPDISCPTCATGFPRLDQVLDPTANKTFAMGMNTLTFSGTGAIEFDPPVNFLGKIFQSTINPASGYASEFGGIVDSTSGPQLGHYATIFNAEAMGDNSITTLSGSEVQFLDDGGTGSIGTVEGHNVLGADSLGSHGVSEFFGYRAASASNPTTVYSFYTDQSVGTNKYAFYGAGTAASHFGGVTDGFRFKSSGTALVGGDFALSAGWGATGSIGTIRGTDQAFEATVTAAGAGQGLNPTVTLTFHDGTWMTVPVFVCNQNGGTGAVSFLTAAPTATTLVITYLGTPVVNLTYVIACTGMGT